MAIKSKKRDVDALVTYLFLKKLMTPFFSSDAYKLKLIDNAGRIIKEPVTDAEKSALTLLDKFVLKIKRLLGSRISNLYNFLYLQTLGQNVYNNLIVMGSTAQRYEIKKIARDFKRLQESVDMSSDEVIYTLLTEEIADQLEQETINESHEQ
jgi:hypothetical protein